MMSGLSSRTAAAMCSSFISGWQVSNIRTSWPCPRITGARVSIPMGGKAITWTRSALKREPAISAGSIW